MNIGRSLALLVLALLITACGQPVPPERAAYVGEWKAESMYLLITQDGSLQYQRRKDGATTSLNGPIKGFDGDNILFGIGALETTFVVEQPPQQIEGRWVIVVDGVELVKTPDQSI
jgi:hypothetical protein